MFEHPMSTRMGQDHGFQLTFIDEESSLVGSDACIAPATDTKPLDTPAENRHRAQSGDDVPTVLVDAAGAASNGLSAPRFGKEQEEAIGTFADLFCGIGGFHYAAEDLGLRCVFACDIDEHAQSQYAHNFGINPSGDIAGVPIELIPDHDLLCAGFPCQPFSIIGNRAGMDDARGTLIYEIARILRGKQPKGFVLENVKQIATHDRGRTKDRIITALEQEGYVCEHTVLNAIDFGLPQKRERFIIVGFRDGEALGRFQWPEPQGPYAPLAKILEASVDQRYFVSERIRKSRHAKHTATVTPSIWHENKGGNVNSHPFSCALRAGASYNYLLVNGERRLTPREQLRLQGFPDSFEVIGSDNQIRKQTGNAVPVPMVRAVMKEFLRATG